MSDIQELKELILFSLDVKPCSVEELKKRDFLINISLYGVEQMLSALEIRGKVYYRGGKYFAYSEEVKELRRKYGSSWKISKRSG